ncbi:glycosyltransferase [Flavobacterium urumqiense]|uniref:Glycosyl transferase family 2 n=1 Tax=Flavobacterium urumqiense TaxID=935224 RepID=A0A1H6AQV7_9FLAO|nr:glycosyltransferase [Flavobacterium urumqiense]SEG51088.1 Glycosyl transferase family 2 [Flavobacterium urumqiense]
MEQLPRVSVCMITYAHENYIRQSVEGVLMQECNFEVELIIVNDCSADDTDAVIEDVLNNHPRASWINYIKHEKNIGMMPNFIFAMKQCKGKYIALCEGDDYWTDPLKLQKQFNFLEANPDYVIHSGSAKILYAKEDVSEIVLGDTSGKTDFVVEDFYTKNNLVTCTVLFRNIVQNYPDSFTTITFGDWFLYVVLLHKSKSKAFVSNAIFSVYRVHEAGAMKQLAQIEKIDAHFQQIKTIEEYIKYKKKSIQDSKNINGYFRNKFMLFLDEGLYARGFRTLVINIKYCSFRTNYMSYVKLSIKHLIKYKKLVE